MPKTVVVNLQRESYDVYIGRAMPGLTASRFANPYKIGVDGSRDAVIALYRKHLRQMMEDDPSARQELEALRGKRLGCFCKPKACHGDVLLEALGGVGADEAQPVQASLF